LGELHVRVYVSEVLNSSIAEGKGCLEDQGVHDRIILRYILKKSGVDTWLMIGTIGGACECRRKQHSCLMKGGAFVARLRESQGLCCVELVS
jgi:hypothetical protein